VAAAGSGERLGAGGPKAFVELGGRPMLAWSLRALAAAEAVGEIVVASPPGTEDRIEQIAIREGIEVRAVPGGQHRSESVAHALAHAVDEAVVVHDAARPLVTAKLIDEVVRRLDADDEAGAVIAAAPVTDTIKQASVSRRVITTLDRSRLWAVQTPQAFRAEALLEAMRRHQGDLHSVTDDASLIEREGGEVLVHEAPAENLKVTTPMDLRLAELLLADRESG